MSESGIASSGSMPFARPEKGHETLHQSIPVTWNWEAVYRCNYRCSYCKYTVDGWEKYEQQNVLPGFERLAEVWRRVFERYGRCHIAMNGGEPSLYPRFFEVCAMLTGMHTLELQTNLTFDVRRFAETMDLKKIRFCTSFHPQFADFDSFFANVLYLRDHGAESVFINYVSYPEQLKDMGRYKKIAKEAGVTFHILPFNGRYKGRVYPQEFTREELVLYEAALSDSDPCAVHDRFKLDWPGNPTKVLDKQTEAGSQKSRAPVFCRMGQKYAKVHPNGDTYRCCANLGSETTTNWTLLRKNVYLGNLFLDDNFKLLDEPAWCDYNPCPCDKCMVVGEESRWFNRWPAPKPFLPPVVRP